MDHLNDCVEWQIGETVLMSSKAQVINQTALSAGMDLYDQIKQACERLEMNIAQFFRAAGDRSLSHVDLPSRLKIISRALQLFRSGSGKWRTLFGEAIMKFLVFLRKQEQKIPDHRKKHLRRRAMGRKVCRNT